MRWSVRSKRVAWALAACVVAVVLIGVGMFIVLSRRHAGRVAVPGNEPRAETRTPEQVEQMVQSMMRQSLQLAAAVRRKAAEEDREATRMTLQSLDQVVAELDADDERDREQLPSQ